MENLVTSVHQESSWTAREEFRHVVSGQPATNSIKATVWILGKKFLGENYMSLGHQLSAFDHPGNLNVVASSYCFLELVNGFRL